MWGINSHFRKRILFPVSEPLKSSAVALFVLINEWTGRLELPHLLWLKTGEESEILLLISHPNSLPHCNDPQVHDKQRCPTQPEPVCMKALQGPKDLSGFIAGIYGHMTQYLSPCLLPLKVSSDLHLSFSGYLTSRANRLPPLRDAGNSVVKSPLMRLDIYETLFPFMAWERLQLQVGRLLNSTWAFLTPLVHTDS